MAYIELKNVCKGFGSGESRSEVLSDINLEIEEGEFIAIVGFSGTGKTTLMNLLAGLEMPDSGEVLVGGEKVEGPSANRGLVFQNYSLLPWLTTAGNVALAVNEVHSKESKAQRSERVAAALEMVNLTEATNKRPAELSGGMRQRNSVARTLSMRPKILLLDEPLSALDALTRSVIQDQILDIWKAEKQTIVLITNDVDEGLYMADRIVPLSIGPGASFGPETVIDLPRPRDRRLLGSDPQTAEMRTEIITYLLGEKARENAGITSVPVTLPNIRPMDISMAKPTKFRGFRPKRKKVLN